MNGLPIVDLDTAAPGDLAEALIRSSCTLVVGHGVPADLHAEMVATSRAFFDLPVAEKAHVRWPGDGQWRGWLPVYEGTSDLNGYGSPELLEKYEIQLPRPWPARDAAADLRWGDGFDAWPAAPAALRPVWTRYYAELGALAERLVTMLIVALDLPEEALDDWCGRHFANLVVNNYLDQSDPPADDQLRIRPHTDIGGLTILWADDAPGGLEVRQPGQRGWTPVTVPAGSYLIQVGDLLARWTNDTIRANIHRVVNPPRALAAHSRRTSIVYFQYPNLDITVAPAPSCVRDGTPVGPPLAAGAHLKKAVEQPKVRHEQLAAALAER